MARLPRLALVCALLLAAGCQSESSKPGAGKDAGHFGPDASLAADAGEVALEDAGPVPDGGCVAKTEVCNYLDDDCNGVTDDPFVDSQGRYVTDSHCGGCNADCNGRYPNATAAHCEIDAVSGTPRCVVTACAEGYYLASLFACLPIVDLSCTSCLEDRNCQIPGDRCLTVSGASFCLWSCTAGTPHTQGGSPACPQGFTCSDGSGAGQTAGFCYPDSGACSCSADVSGREVACRTPANSFGSCWGTMHCLLGTSGWAWTVCQGPVAAAEVCNGLDDNCDGAIDEDFRDPVTGLYDKLADCGACNRACTVLHGTPACVIAAGAASCTAQLCDPGYYLAGNACLAVDATLSCAPCLLDADCVDRGDRCIDVGGDSRCAWSCDPAVTVHPLRSAGKYCLDGYDCSPIVLSGSTEQLCVPKSGACDCLPADDGTTRVCSVANAFGTCFGQRTCAAATGWSVCTAATPAPETCNGVDDNCDGQTDEGFGRGQPCDNGEKGICRVTGQTVCKSDGSGAVCNAPSGAGNAVAERCNGFDDNCDGQTDEGFNVGQLCDNGQKGVCYRAGTIACATDELSSACNAADGSGSKLLAELCNGLDDDCNGLIDDGLSWTDPVTFDVDPLGGPCALGVGECRVSGTVVCAALAATCSATAGTPSAETCNYLDDNCDGATDEPFVDALGHYAVDWHHCGGCNQSCAKSYPLAHEGTDTSFGCRYNAVGGFAECFQTCIGGYADANGDPRDGCEYLVDAGAVYVRTDGTDQASCGGFLDDAATVPWEGPCKTIGYGIGRAAALGRPRVLVASGVYNESFSLLDGVSVLGGYSAQTWKRDIVSNAAVIFGSSGAVANPKAVTALGPFAKATLFEGFVVFAENATVASGNSYAIWIANADSHLSIKSTEVYAGRGARGAVGGNGTPGAVGVAGGTGSNYFASGTGVNATCPGLVVPARSGGAGGARTCGGVSVGGGNGGTAVCPLNNTQEASGVAGKTAGAGNGSGGPLGLGGFDGYNVAGACNTWYVSGSTAGVGGNGGGAGTNGAAGLGCATAGGTVVGREWLGGAGTAGGSATHGGGGGGGGAGGGADDQAACGNNDTLGGSGGGGGSGGCGGTLGFGGQAGGGAFGIFVTFDVASANFPVLSGNTFHGGEGGQGGDGGNGGAGGGGGAGGSGGTTAGAYAFLLGAGGAGGWGGGGGHGGAGGGGCGGAAFGIFVNGASAATGYAAANSFVGASLAGAAGSGGVSLGNSAPNGAPGASGPVNVP